MSKAKVSRPASTFKRRLWILVNPRKRNKILAYAGIALIVLNITALMLDTVEELAAWHFAFDAVEQVSLVLFTGGYLACVYSCTASRRYRTGIRGRLRYMRTPAAIIDLLSIAPALSPQGADPNSMILKVFRINRVFRLLKLARYSDSIALLEKAFRQSLGLVFASTTIALGLLVIMAALLYEVEHEAQPQVFRSIPASFWCAWVTMTTIAYGDMVPITALGKLVTMVFGLLSLSLVTVAPVSFAASLVSLLTERRIQKKRVSLPPLEWIGECPHCGKLLFHTLPQRWR